MGLITENRVAPLWCQSEVSFDYRHLDTTWSWVVSVDTLKQDFQHIHILFSDWWNQDPLCNSDKVSFPSAWWHPGTFRPWWVADLPWWRCWPGWRSQLSAWRVSVWCWPPLVPAASWPEPGQEPAEAPSPADPSPSAPGPYLKDTGNRKLVPLPDRNTRELQSWD